LNKELSNVFKEAKTPTNQEMLLMFTLNRKILYFQLKNSKDQQK